MVSGWTLLWRYSLFAVLATAANLGAQRLVLMGGDRPGRYLIAVLAGTAVGLVVKYVLDKRWIFGDDETGLKAHGRKFTLYTIMGGVTTALFWGAETGFWLWFGTHEAREIGALLGLMVGYVVKYQLDRRITFAPRAEDL